MPFYAVWNGQLVSVEDMYRLNISKETEFECLNCSTKLRFRQKRDADNNFVEHFYHPNTLKGTHIECEEASKVLTKRDDTWHNKMSAFVCESMREVVRIRADGSKHIIDAFDKSSSTGVEFQNSPISVEAVESRDATTHLDWIFNVESQFVRKIMVGGDMGVCEIPHKNWERAVVAVKNRVYLYTGRDEWIELVDRDNFRVEVCGIERNVWIGRLVDFKSVCDATCLKNTLTPEGKKYFESVQRPLPTERIIYARCRKSMFLLDQVHRTYVSNREFGHNEVVAIKSVAGSGKTTTLLTLARAHFKKRILYMAFNKSLATEIRSKLRESKMKNVHACTFDSMLLKVFRLRKKVDPDIFNLTPRSVRDVIPSFAGGSFDERQSLVKLFRAFCRQHELSSPREFCEYLNDTTNVSPLTALWEKCTSLQLVTFESMRKLSVLEHWFARVVDEQYDMIMLDETQDFDMMMLRMLLDDTNIPKIFVGDPNQSIYEWRGCINGFDHMPSHALVVEFYSTFRIGEPACEEISNRFRDCWMISKSKNETLLLSSEVTFDDREKYVYLFRTWRRLLQTAATMQQVWINGYEKKKEEILKKKKELLRPEFEDDSLEDDISKFLRDMTPEELSKLVAQVDVNVVDQEEDARCKMYTVHAYKGLENANVRICDDVQMCGDNKLYYVALTRGIRKICED